ncbi:MAG: hypothetical protein AAFP04_04745 [Myxococcota bacterium]
MNTRCVTSIVALLAACGGSFDPYSEINGPRLLALRASPSTLAPGETTQVDALVVDTTAPRMRWRWCPLLGGPSNDFECLIDEDTLSDTLVGAGGDRVSYDLGADEVAEFSHLLPGSAIDAVCQQLAAIELPNLTSTIDCTQGLPISVVVDAQLDGRTVVAVKEVLLLASDQAPFFGNRNPTVLGLSLRVDGNLVVLTPGSPPSLAAGETRDLVADIPLESSETYSGVDGPTRERLVMSWFTTAGELDTERETFIDGERDFEEARDVEWTAPPPGDALEGTIDFYVVVRDDRGGVSWAQGAVELEKPQ